MEVWNAIQPAVIAALQYLIPAAATALGVWLRARGIKQAAQDGAVHAAIKGGSAEEQEELATVHANEHSNWARMTASNKSVRATVKAHGPAAVRVSTAPAERNWKPPAGDPEA